MAKSGTIKKKVYDTLGSKIYLIVDWERIGFSIDDNTTTIRYTPKMETIGFAGTVDINYYYKFGDSDTFSGIKSFNSNSGSISFDSVEITSKNNTNGGFNQLCQFHVDWTTPITSYAFNLSEYLTIDAIPVKATLTRVDNFNDEEDFTIYYDNPSRNIIAVGLYTTSGSRIASSIGLSPTAGMATVPISDADRIKIRQLMTRDTSMKVMVRLESRIVNPDTGATEFYFSSLYPTVSLINHEPILNPTVRDTNSLTITLTGDNSKFIRYFSNLYFDTGAVARKEATIDNQYIICGSQSIEDPKNNIGTIKKIDNNTVYFSVTDSRNVTTKDSIILDLIPYVKLTGVLRIAAFTLSGDLIFALDGNYYNGSFGAQDNALEISYQLKKNGQVIDTKTLNTSTEGTLTYNGDSYHYEYMIEGLTPIEANGSYNTYSVQATINDKITDSITTTEVYSTAAPVFHWGKNDFTFNVPVHFNRGFTSDVGIKTAYLTKSLSITAAGSYVLCTLDELGISSYSNDIYTVLGSITSEDAGKIYTIPSPPLGNETGTYVIGDSTKFYIENDTVYITVGAA